MPLENLTKRIYFDAEKAKEAIIANAKREVEKILKDADKEKKELSIKTKKDLKRILDENKRRISAAGRHKKKLLETGAKEQVINNILKKGLEELNNISSESYKEFVEKTIRNIRFENKNNIKIIVPENRLNDIKEIINKLNIRDAEIKTHNEIKGGFVISIDNVFYDLTFENLLNNRKNELIIELRNKLFNSKHEND